MFKNECPWSVSSPHPLSLIFRAESIRAYQALRLLLVPSQSSKDNIQVDGETLNKFETHDGKLIPAIEFFDQLEIYPGEHFQKIKWNKPIWLPRLHRIQTHPLQENTQKNRYTLLSNGRSHTLLQSSHRPTHNKKKQLDPSCSLTTNLETKKLNL